MKWNAERSNQLLSIVGSLLTIGAVLASLRVLNTYGIVAGIVIGGQSIALMALWYRNHSLRKRLRSASIIVEDLQLVALGAYTVARTGNRALRVIKAVQRYRVEKETIHGSIRVQGSCVVAEGADSVSFTVTGDSPLSFVDMWCQSTERDRGSGEALLVSRPALVGADGSVKVLAAKVSKRMTKDSLFDMEVEWKWPACVRLEGSDYVSASMSYATGQIDQIEVELSFADGAPLEVRRYKITEAGASQYVDTVKPSLNTDRELAVVYRETALSGTTSFALMFSRSRSLPADSRILSLQPGPREEGTS